MPKRLRPVPKADSPFLASAKAQFQFLEETYGYAVAETSDHSTWAAVVYENVTVQAAVSAGLELRDGWMYVQFRHIDPEATGPQRTRRSYYLGNILALRNPEAEATLSKQLTAFTAPEIAGELSKLAAYTALYAGDVLQGDFHVFDALDLVG